MEAVCHIAARLALDLGTHLGSTNLVYHCFGLIDIFILEGYFKLRLKACRIQTLEEYM